MTTIPQPLLLSHSSSSIEQAPAAIAAAKTFPAPPVRLIRAEAKSTTFLRRFRFCKISAQASLDM